MYSRRQQSNTAWKQGRVLDVKHVKHGYSQSMCLSLTHLSALAKQSQKVLPHIHKYIHKYIQTIKVGIDLTSAANCLESPNLTPSPHLRTDSLTHSLTHSFTHSLSLSLSLTLSFSLSLIHSLIHSLTHSFTHSLTRSFTSLTHSLAHSFTH